MNKYENYGTTLFYIFVFFHICCMLWATHVYLVFPTTFMLRVSFSPVPECVEIGLLESSFSDPPAAPGTPFVVMLNLALKLIHWLVFVFCSWAIFFVWNPIITTQRYFLQKSNIQHWDRNSNFHF